MCQTMWVVLCDTDITVMWFGDIYRIMLICSGNSWLSSLLRHRWDERRQRHVPDVAASVPPSVRPVDDALCQVTSHCEAHPEYRRLSDVQHVLVHSSRPLREGQVPLQHPDDVEDSAAGKNRRTRRVSVLHQRSRTRTFSLFILYNDIGNDNEWNRCSDRITFL